MTTARKTTRAKSVGLNSRVDFEVTVDRVSWIDTEIRRLQAERDRAVQIAQTMHADAIAELEDEMKAKLALCEKYADEHRSELLPDKAKSARTPLSTFGFALSNKKAVKPTSRKIEESTIVEALKASGLGDYVRVAEEIAKDKIIADAKEDAELKVVVLINSRGNRVILTELGLKLVQNESFFIEPNVDGGERQTGGAS